MASLLTGEGTAVPLVDISMEWRVLLHNRKDRSYDLGLHSTRHPNMSTAHGIMKRDAQEPTDFGQLLFGNLQSLGKNKIRRGRPNRGPNCCTVAIVRQILCHHKGSILSLWASQHLANTRFVCVQVRCCGSGVWSITHQNVRRRLPWRDTCTGQYGHLNRPPLRDNLRRACRDAQKEEESQGKKVWGRMEFRQVNI